MGKCTVATFFGIVSGNGERETKYGLKMKTEFTDFNTQNQIRSTCTKEVLVLKKAMHKRFKRNPEHTRNEIRLENEDQASRNIVFQYNTIRCISLAAVFGLLIVLRLYVRSFMTINLIIIDHFRVV